MYIFFPFLFYEHDIPQMCGVVPMQFEGIWLLYELSRGQKTNSEFFTHGIQVWDVPIPEYFVKIGRLLPNRIETYLSNTIVML